MRFKGYTIKPATGRRIVADQPVKVYTKGRFVANYESADIAKEKILWLRRKYRIAENEAIKAQDKLFTVQAEQPKGKIKTVPYSPNKPLFAGKVKGSQTALF